MDELDEWVSSSEKGNSYQIWIISKEKAKIETFWRRQHLPKSTKFSVLLKNSWPKPLTKYKNIGALSPTKPVCVINIWKVHRSV